MPETGWLDAVSWQTVNGPDYQGQPAIDWTVGNSPITDTKIATGAGFTDYFELYAFPIAAAGVLSTYTINGIDVKIEADRTLQPNGQMQLQFFRDLPNHTGGGASRGIDCLGIGNPQTIAEPGQIWGTTASTADVLSSNFGLRVWGLNTTADAMTFSLGRVQIKVHYSLAEIAADVTTEMVLAGGVVSTDVTTSMVVGVAGELDVVTSMVVGLAFNIDTPAPGQSLTDANVTVTWSLSPGVQSDYRVRVYSLANALLYDSGVIASPTQAHVIPAVLPSPTTVQIRVDVTTTTLSTASATVIVFTNFATAVNVTGLRLAVMDQCVDPTILPAIVLRWNQVSPGAGETFIQYDVRRRVAGDTEFQRIAIVEGLGTLTYRDTRAAPGVAYEYAVVYEATSGATTLISTNQSPAVVGQLAFDFNFLHDPVDELFARVDGWEIDVNVVQDVKYVQPWGRPLPTAHVGETFGHEIAMRLHPRLLREGQWATLQTLLARQQQGRVLCLRLGRAEERYFVTVARAQKNQSQKTYAASLNLVETNYDEAV